MGLQIIDFIEEARGGVKIVDSEISAHIKTVIYLLPLFLFLIILYSLQDLSS